MVAMRVVMWIIIVVEVVRIYILVLMFFVNVLLLADPFVLSFKVRAVVMVGYCRVWVPLLINIIILVVL